MIITKLAFRNLFTFDERVAMTTAAESNAIVRTLLEDMNTASQIDLALEQTQQGVGLLETLGIIGVGRAAEILATPASAIPADSLISEIGIPRYDITVKALADITIDNMYGAELTPNDEYQVRVNFKNVTTGEILDHIFVFGYIPPTQEEMDAEVQETLRSLKVNS